jgi:predicted TIM-barrel fold metal-dependent hydrolase
MFGSDWPVCTLAASYAEVLELARSVLGPGEREAVLAGTARRFYRPGPSAAATSEGVPSAKARVS